MSRLRRYIQPYTVFIVLTLTIKFLGVAAELLIPYFMEILLDTTRIYVMWSKGKASANRVSQNGICRRLYESQFDALCSAKKNLPVAGSLINRHDPFATGQMGRLI